MESINFKAKHGRLYPIDKHGEPKGKSKSKLDTKGAMTLKQQLQRFDAAGAYLEAFRRGNYDTDNHEEVGFSDNPALDPDFDMSTDHGALEAYVKNKSELSTSLSVKSSGDNKENRSEDVTEETGASGQIPTLSANGAPREGA